MKTLSKFALATVYVGFCYAALGTGGAIGAVLVVWWLS